MVVGWLSLMSLAAWVPTTASAAPITYVDANFDSGALDFGFGSAKYPFGRASNTSASHLDGRALEFRVDDQMEWVRIDHPESPFHRISFDYYAEAGATLTQFLDVPSVLRLDVRMVGRHHIDLEYDLVAKTAQVWIDGVFDGSLLSILAWPVGLPTISSGIRIGNQGWAPGNSLGTFQLDNLRWQGFSEVPEPGTATLVLTGLVGLAARRLRHRP